jgi:hypothetical protein
MRQPISHYSCVDYTVPLRTEAAHRRSCQEGGAMLIPLGRFSLVPGADRRDPHETLRYRDHTMHGVLS